MKYLFCRNLKIEKKGEQRKEKSSVDNGSAIFVVVERSGESIDKKNIVADRS